MSELQKPAIECVLAERKKQDEKWGEQNHSPSIWMSFLNKEIGDVADALIEYRRKGLSENLWRYRTELVQVAAVAVAMIECFDRNLKNGGAP